jgi:hypothetical protein
MWGTLGLRAALPPCLNGGTIREGLGSRVVRTPTPEIRAELRMKFGRSLQGMTLSIVVVAAIASIRPSVSATDRPAPKVLQWRVTPEGVEALPPAFASGRRHDAVVAPDGWVHLVYGGVDESSAVVRLEYLRYEAEVASESGYDGVELFAEASVVSAPSVALARDGAVGVAWNSYPHRKREAGRVWLARFGSDGVFRGVNAVGSAGIAPTDPKLHVAENDRAFVHFSSSEAAEASSEVFLYFSDFPDGDWRKAVLDLRGEGEADRSPALATGGDGDTVYLAWVRETSRGSRLLMARSGNGGATWPGEPAFVNDQWVARIGDVTLCVTDEAILAFWVESERWRRRILTAVSVDGGATWGDDRVLVDQNVGAIAYEVHSLGGDLALVWLGSRSVGRFREDSLGWRGFSPVTGETTGEAIVLTSLESGFWLDEFVVVPAGDVLLVGTIEANPDDSWRYSVYALESTGRFGHRWSEAWSRRVRQGLVAGALGDEGLGVLFRESRQRRLPFESPYRGHLEWLALRFR